MLAGKLLYRPLHEKLGQPACCMKLLRCMACTCVPLDDEFGKKCSHRLRLNLQQYVELIQRFYVYIGKIIVTIYVPQENTRMNTSCSA